MAIALTQQKQTTVGYSLPYEEIAKMLVSISSTPIAFCNILIGRLLCFAIEKIVVYKVKFFVSIVKNTIGIDVIDASIFNYTNEKRYKAPVMGC